MYTLTQNQSFSDEIKLEKKDGTIEILEIKINLNPDLVQKYRSLQVQMIDLQSQYKNNPENPQIIENIGKVVVDIFSLLFGEENTKKLLEFYDEDYTQMLSDLFPYIQNVLVPKITEVAKKRQKNLKRKIWK